MDEKPKKKNKPVSDFDALHSIAVATGAGFTLLSSIGLGLNAMSILAQSPSD